MTAPAGWQAVRGPARAALATPEQRAALALLPRRYQFFSEEGVAVLLQPSRIGESGTLFTAAATVYPPRVAATEKSAKAATKKATPPEEKSATAKKALIQALCDVGVDYLTERALGDNSGFVVVIFNANAIAKIKEVDLKDWSSNWILDPAEQSYNLYR